eukprot:jgi/Chrzof1/12537/Cz06g37230.t1
MSAKEFAKLQPTTDTNVQQQTSSITAGMEQQLSSVMASPQQQQQQQQPHIGVVESVMVEVTEGFRHLLQANSSSNGLVVTIKVSGYTSGDAAESAKNTFRTVVKNGSLQSQLWAGIDLTLLNITTGSTDTSGGGRLSITTIIIIAVAVGGGVVAIASAVLIIRNIRRKGAAQVPPGASGLHTGALATAQYLLQPTYLQVMGTHSNIWVHSTPTMVPMVNYPPIIPNTEYPGYPSAPPMPAVTGAPHYPPHMANGNGMTNGNAWAWSQTPNPRAQPTMSNVVPPTDATATFRLQQQQQRTTGYAAGYGK